jgi:hypothetical protein
VRSPLETCSETLNVFLINIDLSTEDKQQLLRAPRIISKSQKFCRHKEAAKGAAEKKNAMSTIEKIA